MAIGLNKPQSSVDAQQNQQPDTPVQSDEKMELAKAVQDKFRASYTAKQSLNLPNNWRMFDDYKHGRQGAPQTAEDPNSVTNIIHPIIESQIADLVDKPYNVQANPREFSDKLYAEQVQHMMEFVLDNNKFTTKLNLSEHDRLELGTAVYKVYFDDDALDGRGLPTMEPVDPANFFNDPKVPYAYRLQESEFLIHAVPRPLSWFRKQFPELGKYVKREVTVPYDPNIYEGQNVDTVQTTTSQRALCIECYMRDEEGELYCVTVANYLVLEDTRETLKGKKLQRRNKFPFVVIPCYPQRGMIWGQGDVELLIPSQDLINELDDQIRINARLMGNPQIVIGMGAGRAFDFRKWTSAPALRVPMRDQNAFRVVEAQPVSRDVVARREAAFAEADKISGRPDVNRGEAPGSGVTAASAIMALQQAGQKSVAHKAKMFKDGYAEVLSLLYDEMIDKWDAEMWVRIDGTQPDFKFYDPRKLTQVPVMIPDETAMQVTPPTDDMGNPIPNPPRDALTQLTDKETGKPITRDAAFDFSLSIGDGFPNDKTFMYQVMQQGTQTIVEGKPLVSWQEFRDFLREQVGLPIGPDDAVMGPQPPQGAPGMPMPGQTPTMPPANVIPLPQGGGPIGAFSQS